MSKQGSSFYDSLKGAGKGIAYSLKTEKHMRVHFFAAFLVVMAGMLFHLTKTQWLFITYAIGSVLVAELFNTALERAVDLFRPNIHPIAGMAKDIAAGAVLITVIQALVIGGVIFGPYLF